MMLGLARKIAQRCGPPVVCSLSGEDIFLEKLRPPHYEHARDSLRERAAEVQAFTALNTYYADFMADYLCVSRDKIHVIPHGLQLEGHGAREERSGQAPLRIGYLARICRDKGLHLLVEATERLIQFYELSDLELHCAGYLGASDRDYLQQLVARTNQGALAGKFKVHGELDRTAKIEFLRSLDVFCTPTVYRESKGLPLLEALANAVPVVVPAHGTFPELIADTGGGLLCKPQDAEDLAKKLAELLLDPVRSQEIGRTGQQAIRERYHAEKMAENTRSLYRRLLDSL